MEGCPKNILNIIRDEQKPCEEGECRYFIENEENLNCTFIFVDKNENGATYKSISKIMGVSTARIKQICDKAVKKISKLEDITTIYE